MNRRSFLKALGALGALGVVATGAVQPLRAVVAAQRYALDFEETPDGLRRAIEALFPAGTEQSAKAYENFGFGLAGPVDADAYSGDVQRVVHVVYGFAFIVTGDPVRDARLRTALYRALYNTAFQVAERPENAGAVLVWRRTPEEATYRRNEFEDDDPGPLITNLTMRIGLRQTGWRERLFVAPWLRGCKPEGAAVRVFNA